MVCTENMCHAKHVELPREMMIVCTLFSLTLSFALVSRCVETNKPKTFYGKCDGDDTIIAIVVI